jgi:hypothetical protein
MRRVLPVCLLIASVLTSPVLAEEETLVGRGVESGGFGAPVVRFSEVNDEFAVFVGARGGWIINHVFFLGGGGYGLANDIDLDKIRNPSFRDVEFGYGGLEMGFIGQSDRIVHFTVQLLIGAGGVTRNDNFVFYDDDAVFVLEPSADVVLNVTTYFRLAAGGGYRMVAGSETPGIDNEDLSAPFASLALKFGRF